MGIHPRTGESRCPWIFRRHLPHPRSWRPLHPYLRRRHPCHFPERPHWRGLALLRPVEHGDAHRRLGTCEGLRERDCRCRLSQHPPLPSREAPGLPPHRWCHRHGRRLARLRAGERARILRHRLFLCPPAMEGAEGARRRHQQLVGRHPRRVVDLGRMACRCPRLRAADGRPRCRRLYR